jgi:hypothetical protein
MREWVGEVAARDGAVDVWELGLRRWIGVFGHGRGAAGALRADLFARRAKKNKK